MSGSVFSAVRKSGRNRCEKVHFDLEGSPACSTPHKADALLTDRRVAVTCDRCLRRTSPDLGPFKIPTGAARYK